MHCSSAHMIYILCIYIDCQFKVRHGGEYCRIIGVTWCQMRHHFETDFRSLASLTRGFQQHFCGYVS